MTICGETDDGEDDLGSDILRTITADSKQLGRIAGVDVVTGGGARVAGEDGEVLATDAERRAAVVGISRKTGERMTGERVDSGSFHTGRIHAGAVVSELLMGLVMKTSRSVALQACRRCRGRPFWAEENKAVVRAGVCLITK